MRELTLKEYVSNGGLQIDVARSLGVTHPAVTKMLSTQRDIRVVLDKRGGIIRAYEIKPLGKQAES